jgi:hypothetical protein
MLLTALALSDDDLLSVLRAPQVLQRIEVFLHSYMLLAAQSATWYPAWHSLHDLQRVVVSLVPIEIPLVEPCSDERVLHTWRDLGSNVSVLQGKLRSATLYTIVLGELTQRDTGSRM